MKLFSHKQYSKYHVNNRPSRQNEDYISDMVEKIKVNCTQYFTNFPENLAFLEEDFRKTFDYCVLRLLEKKEPCWESLPHNHCSIYTYMEEPDQKDFPRDDSEYPYLVVKVFTTL